MSRFATASRSAPPMPGVVEDVLDDDHAAGEVGEVERDHLERRAERVRQRVAPDHVALGHALQPGHLDVVALEHLDHRRAHDPGDVRRDRDHERQRRQDHLLQVLPRPLAGRARTRRPAAAWNTVVANSTTSVMPTTNSGSAARAASPIERRRVEDAVAPQRGVRADRDRERDRDQPGDEHQERRVDRAGRAGRSETGSRAASDVPRSPCSEAGDPVPVLAERRAGRGAAARAAAFRLAGVAVRPRIARAGSPGSAWVAANTTTETSDEHEQAEQHPAEDESREPTATSRPSAARS